MAHRTSWAHGRNTTETSSFKQIMHSLSLFTPFSEESSSLSNSWSNLAIVSPWGFAPSQSRLGNVFNGWTSSVDWADTLRRESSCSSLCRSSLWRWKSISIFRRRASSFLLLLASAASLARRSSSTCTKASSLAFKSCLHFTYNK